MANYQIAADAGRDLDIVDEADEVEIDGVLGDLLEQHPRRGLAHDFPMGERAACA